MKRFLLLSFAFLVGFCCKGQPGPLYKLENGIIKGEKASLVKLTFYLDSPRQIIEIMGYHRLEVTERSIAVRILQENCLFLNQEVQFDSLTGAKCRQFLELNKDRLIFDDTTSEFLITPLSGRTTQYELRSLTKEAGRRIDSLSLYNAYPDWVYAGGITKLLADKNPLALLRIASAFYKTRDRFNRYSFDEDDYLNLVKRLTREELSVPGEDDFMTSLYKGDFYGIAKLNYLIYWVNHYRDYQWDDGKKRFVNIKAKVREKSDVERYFELLPSDNDSAALDAFVRLTEEDISTLTPFLKDYNGTTVRLNPSLPIFTINFLKVSCQLVQYCKANHILYKATGRLDLRFKKLLSNDLVYAERYQLENVLINTLSLDEITQLEYFGLINEENWDATYSVGRILDKFYSKNWRLLIEDKQAMKLYLKKSSLFNSLGIIGNCGKYLKKFANSSSEVLQRIQELAADSSDMEISAQAQKIVKAYSTPVAVSYTDKKTWDGNDDYSEPMFSKKVTAVLHYSNKDSVSYGVSRLVGKIKYEQIGEVLRLYDKDTAFSQDCYDFLKFDFGFPINIQDSERRAWFEKDYETLNEYALSYKYLLALNPEYAHAIGDSNYNKVYELLKYDVVDAFVGGGGGRREDGVYLLIKLLELRFGTTLGFPRKKCNSMGMYGCNCADRAKYWQRFLLEKGLVKKVGEPVSISNN